tara:strand:- start:146166 stop:146774 length:609 start_codon:yes stop_codon:yes gene_type:complete
MVAPNKKRSAVQTMRPLSDNFTRSFELFTHFIANCNDDRDIRIYNIAVITNCVAYTEGALNEKLQGLQTEKAFREAEYEEIDAACDISSIKKFKKIRQKWNRIKNMEGSTNKWDEENSIFSNFSSLYTLRNEVLHYKCDYLEAGEVPKESIENIMHQVCDEQPYGNMPYRKQMNESWCSYLLMQKSLCEWSITTTKNLTEKI